MIKLRKMIEFTKYIFFIILLLQLFTFNTACPINQQENQIEFPDEKDSIKLSRDSLRTVIQTVVPIFKIYRPNNGLYLCNGILIHFRAVLASRACIRDFLSHDYAISLYKWENDRASINRTQLYNVQYFLNSYVFFGFLKKDKSLPNARSESHEYVNIKMPILLVLKDPIHSMVPADFTHSLTSNDINNEKVSKECYRLVIAPDFSKTNSSIHSAITYDIKSDDKILTPSEIEKIYYASVHQKYVDDMKNNTNISLHYVNNDSIFVTDHQEVDNNDISRSSGAPLICRRHSKDPFTLTGILIDTLENFPTYFAINEDWTTQKLTFLNRLQQFTYNDLAMHS